MFTAHVYCLKADEITAHAVREAFGDLRERARVSSVERDDLALPRLDPSPSGTCIVVVSSAFVRGWFTGAPWAARLGQWRAAGGKALVIHPDTSTGPLDWPELELGHVPPQAREAALYDFLDLPRSLALRFDADHDDDARGALEHARGVFAWQRNEAAEAARCFELALAARGALHEGDPRRAASENALGAALTRIGRHAESIPILESALARRSAWLGSQSRQTAMTANNLGIALLSAGAPERAAPLLVHATEALLDLGPSCEARARACAAHAAAALEVVGDHSQAGDWVRVSARATGARQEQDLLLN